MKPETKTEPANREITILDSTAARIPEDELAGVEDRERDVAAEILGVLSELGDDTGSAKVSIWRLRPPTGVAEFLDDWLPSEFSMKRLADDFGGGTYNVRVYVPNMQTINGALTQKGVKLAKNGRVTVGGKMKDPRATEGVPVVIQSQQPQALDSMAGVLADSIKELGRIMLESRGVAQSPVQQMREFLELQKLMKDLAPAQAAIDPFSMLERVMALKDKLGLNAAAAGGDEASLGMLFIKEVMPLLKNFAETAKSQNAGAALGELPPPENLDGAPPVLSVVQSQPAAAPVAQTEEDMFNASRLIYKGYVMILCQNARANTPVAEYAPEVLDNVPDAMYDDFMALIKSPDYMARLIDLDNRASLYRAWFEQLQAELIRLDALPDSHGSNL